MNKNEWKKWTGVVGRMLLAYSLILAQGAWAGQNQATKDKPSSPQKATAQQTMEKQSAMLARAETEQAQGEESERAVAAQKSSGKGSHEGIKVHGHWTIEVRNPDGTVVTHREFENSLQPRGAVFLSLILGHQNTVGAWELAIIGSSAQPCVTTTSAPAPCIIAEPALTGTGAFLTLNVSGGGGSLVLSGTAVAGQNGVIDSVQSIDFVCATSVSPATCTNNPIASYLVTQAQLSPGINVSLGQTVAVTVSISFS